MAVSDPTRPSNSHCFEFRYAADSGIQLVELLKDANDPLRTSRCGIGYCVSSSQSASVPGMARSMSIIPARASSVIE